MTAYIVFTLIESRSNPYVSVCKILFGIIKSIIAVIKTFSNADIVIQ